MKYLAIALPVVLAACGGGSSTTEPVIDDLIAQRSACNTTYYTELSGTYDGQIDFSGKVGNTEAEALCTWDVEADVIASVSGDDSCSLQINIASTVISGGAECGTSIISADITEPLEGVINLAILDAPQWPLEVLAHQARYTSGAGTIQPVGVRFERFSQFGLVFDGAGNITYTDIDSTDTNVFTGVLVKQ